MSASAARLTRSPYRHLSIESRTVGRIRLRVRGLYRNPALRARLLQLTHALPGLRLARINELNGAALLLLQPNADPDALLACLEQVLAEEGVPPRHHPAVAAAEAPARSQARQPAAAADRWHAISGSAVLEALGSHRGGLRSEEAARRLRERGANRLPQPKPRAGFDILLSQFQNLPTALLGGAALLSVATGGAADALVIGAVLLANGLIGYRTEAAAERAIGALNAGGPRRALALRDGQRRELDLEALVPGDVVQLEAGHLVPADARLLHATELRVDESALTGESLPVRKRAAFTGPPTLPLGDRQNMLYRGTTVTSGSGVAVVVATGRDTTMGQVHGLVAETRPPQTPLQREMDRLSARLTYASLTGCAVLFGLGLLRGQGGLPMLKAAVSLGIAAIPEGLTTVATTTLAVGIRDLGRHKVAIRKLQAVEGLGAVQVLCLDKTGTLTENRMSVVAVQAGDRRLDINGNGDATAADDDAVLRRLWEAVALCNDCPPGPDACSGSPTESALMRAAAAGGVDLAGLREAHPRRGTLPRSEERPLMATYHEAGGRCRLAVKGSPETVLELCRWRLENGERKPLTDADRRRLLEANQGVAAEALRVLAVADGEADDEESELGDLTWLGLVGMADPVRPGVRQVMRRLHQAGVRTVMITGDQSATARAIGHRLNLADGEALEIIDSAEMERLDRAELAERVKRTHIFARVSPTHKLQIVRAFQDAGLVVAMTGDGINDGPALRAADVGIAMGGAGSDVARDVADVVLEDDELSTLLLAVERGRAIRNNIRRSVRYLVSTNTSETVVMVGGVGLGLGAPVSAMQLLWLNLVTDVFPALALALEPAGPHIMREPPRDPHRPFIGRQDMGRMAREAGLLSAATLGSFACGRARYGAGPVAGGLAFHTLATAQLLHAISARSERLSIFRPGGRPPNRPLRWTLGGSLVLQALTVLFPPLRKLLGLTPLGLMDVLVISAGAAAPLLINEASKPGPRSLTTRYRSAANRALAECSTAISRSLRPKAPPSDVRWEGSGDCGA